jgi:competence protein ComEA
MASAKLAVNHMPQRFMLFYVILSLSASLAVAAPDDKAQLPDAPGKATVMKVCNTCHGAEVVLGHPHSEEGWNAVIIDMAQRGAEATEPEFDEIVQYLTKNIKAGQAQAKLNINKATVKAIEVGLGLTTKEAEAIVAAREKSPFKSVDDVKKVPGIDAAKIEAKKDKLAFE